METSFGINPLRTIKPNVGVVEMPEKSEPPRGSDREIRARNCRGIREFCPRFA